MRPLETCAFRGIGGTVPPVLTNFTADVDKLTDAGWPWFGSQDDCKPQTEVRGVRRLCRRPR